MNEIIENMVTRRSIRKYKPDMISQEFIEEIIKAGTYGAPVVLIVLADKNCGTYIYDGSLVMGNLMNAAHSLNIGSCWIHRAKEEFETEEGKEILKSLGIQGNYEGIGHCILGYLEEEIREPLPRKENYVYYIK